MTNLERNRDVAIVGGAEGAAEHTNSKSRSALHRKESTHTSTPVVVAGWKATGGEIRPISDSEHVASRM